jgi:hypothetical protein
LKEELGLAASSMTRLGTLWIAPGFLRQKQHVFLATGLTATETNPDVEEHDLVPHCVAVTEFEQMILDGTITDGPTVSGWGFYLLWKAMDGAERNGSTGSRDAGHPSGR